VCCALDNSLTNCSRNVAAPAEKSLQCVPVPLRESIAAPAQPDHNPAAGFSELMLSFYDFSFDCDCIFSLVSMTTVRTLILKLWLLAYFPYFEKK
jgi:hypothetical protein